LLERFHTSKVLWFSKTNSPQQDCSLLPSNFKRNLFINLEQIKDKQSSQAIYINFFDQLSLWGLAHFQIKLRDPVYDVLNHGVTRGKKYMDDSVGWVRVKGGKPFSLVLRLYLSF
jgi:hypothetical protein